MIQYGDPTKIPQLKQLWKECFSDEDAYIHDFFQAMYENEHVLLEEENGMLIGASFFLPGNVWMEQPGANGCWQPIRYVYALAVWPQFRGRGAAARLLKKANELYKAPLLAEPAEEGLIGGFYRPLGFRSDFYINKSRMEMPHYNVRAAQSDAWTWIPADAKTYLSMRDTYFRQHGYVSWPEQHVAFALQQHRDSGGGAYILRRDDSDRQELLLYYTQNQDAVITETTLDDPACMELMAPRIAGACSRLTVIRPAQDTAGQGADSSISSSLIGMSYRLPAVRGYLNLSLD